MVFPESTLAVTSSENGTINRSQTASYIPDPDDNIIPCDDKDQRYKNVRDFIADLYYFI